MYVPVGQVSYHMKNKHCEAVIIYQPARLEASSAVLLIFAQGQLNQSNVLT